MTVSLIFDQLNEGGALYNYILRRHREIDFVSTNSADSDEIPRSVSFHLGLHSLQNYSFRGFWSRKV